MAVTSRATSVKFISTLINVGPHATVAAAPSKTTLSGRKRGSQKPVVISPDFDATYREEEEVEGDDLATFIRANSTGGTESTIWKIKLVDIVRGIWIRKLEAR